MKQISAPNAVYKIFMLSLFVCIFLIDTGSVWATSVPSSADPSRSLSEAQSKPLDFQKAEPKEIQASAPVRNAPEGADKTFFIFKSVRFVGMTAYSDGQISQIYSKDLDQNISVARLFEIMNDIQKKYLDDGYTLSRVGLPTQDISKGDVVIQVIEGYAAEVEFDGIIAKNSVLEDALSQISAMRPLNTKRLERILLILNDMPDFNVSAILGGVKSQTPEMGAMRLTLKQNATSRPLVTFGLNNHGSEFSGPFQMVASGKKINIISAFDELNATISAAIPIKEMKYIALKYQKPVWGVSGANLSFDATLGRTEPGSTLKDLEVKGRSESLKATISYPLIRQRDQTLRINLSAEARQTKTDLLGSRLYDDRLRIVGLGATYNSADSYSGLNALEMTYSQGFDVLGVRKAGSVDLSRNEGRPDFQKIFASAGRVQSLPYNFDVLMAFQGQYAFDPLLSSEEFGFGGGQMGRGYDPSEITGDKGIAATLEIRKNIVPQNFVAALQAYTFYDFGKVWDIDPSSKNAVSAASSGVGLRVGLPSGWSGDLNMSVPLTKDSENPPKYSNGQSPRILVSLQKKI
jgi:hemolysin activation/secretion protein